MIQLIKNIEGDLIDINTGSVNEINSIEGLCKEEDYIDVFGYIAYTQNFTKVSETVLLTKPINFGLKNRLDLQIVDLKIDY